MHKYHTALPHTPRYKRGIKLAGVLYFHRISDVRMSGAPVKNFKMFQKLCGENTLQNVVIVTNMWGGVDRRVGEKREAELKGKDIFFKPVLDKRGQMARHLNTTDSARDILRLILHNPPLPLCIQVELVDEHKDISRTSAGEELNRELNARIRKHKEEVRALEEEMHRAMKDKDEEIRKELEEETKKVQGEIKRIEVEAEKMASDYRRRERELKALETQLAEQEVTLYDNWVPQLTLEPDLFSIVVTACTTILVSTVFNPSSPRVAMSALITALISSVRARSP